MDTGLLLQSSVMKKVFFAALIVCLASSAWAADGQVTAATASSTSPTGVSEPTVAASAVSSSEVTDDPKEESAEADEVDVTADFGGKKIRSILWISDYHREAQRIVKLMRDAALRVQRLRERSGSELVVLEKLLKTNAESIDALSRVAEDARLRLKDQLPPVEEEPTERERKTADRFLRQLVVLKDRALALYRDSAVFYKKLSVETKNNVVTRIENKPEIDDDVDLSGTSDSDDQDSDSADTDD